MAETWDAIVIGSGMGGLSAAGFLAKVAGMRVLVLEKHWERGGQTHMFRRDGASWDVGVHYIGELQKGSMMRTLFDFLSNGALGWNRMPDEFERFVYPGLTFSVPSDAKRYQARLIERFPDEAAAVRRYFRDLGAAALWHILGIQQAFLPTPLNSLLALWRRLGAARATQATGDYLRRRFKSPQLRALLATQWGDYGLPPGESAFAIHALVAGSYLNGGWFPQGGAGRIARTFEPGVEARGGAIKVRHEVTAILTEGGRAVGVKALDRRAGEPVEVEFRAPIVISDVGARTTYRRLLPTDGEIGRRTAKARAYIDSVVGGLSAVTLYLRLDQPVATLGVEGENYWINTTFEHDDLDAQTAALLAGEPRRGYLSFPSAKSGDDRFHTAEICAFVRPQAFATWRGTVSGQRGGDYAELKERIAKGLLRLADCAAPGLSKLTRYYELSTPLTMEDFTSHPAGAFYGLPGAPARYRSPPLSPRTPVAGLYLTGSDAAAPGVPGAMMGGVAAASQILGSTGFLRIMAAAYRGKAPAKETTSRSPEKKLAALAAKTALTPSIWRLEFELDEPIAFVAGQYVKLRVAPFEWRDYSIAAASGRRLTLLISTRTGGDGSLYASAAEPGAITEVEGPFGGYRLDRNAHRKVFVATGTGLAPFLPMFAEMAANGELGAAELYFGCRAAADNIARGLAPLPRTIVCMSRDPAADVAFHGRVSQALSGLAFEPATTDFYVCGSAVMVADCRAILERAGARRILTELF